MSYNDIKTFDRKLSWHIWAHFDTAEISFEALEIHIVLHVLWFGDMHNLHLPSLLSKTSRGLYCDVSYDWIAHKQTFLNAAALTTHPPTWRQV